MDSKLIPILKRSSLFRGLSAGEVERILHSLPYRPQSYTCGATVACRGDRYRRLWIIVSGYAEGVFRDFDGKVLKVETIHAPETIASAVLFSSQQSLPVDLRAQTDLQLISIEREELVRLMQEERQILLNYLEDSGDRLSLLADKLKFIQFSTIREKLTAYLLDLAERQKSDNPVLHHNREQMAELFGVSRPSLSRELGNLVKEGLLSLESGRIRIHRKQRLYSLLHRKENI